MNKYIPCNRNGSDTWRQIKLRQAMNLSTQNAKEYFPSSIITFKVQSSFSSLWRPGFVNLSRVILDHFLEIGFWKRLGLGGLDHLEAPPWRILP